MRMIVKARILNIIKKRFKGRKYTDKVKFLKVLRPTDIFLVGHPKSGNTWLAYMLGIVLAKENSKKVTMANVGEFVPNIHCQDERIGEFKNLTSPRIFRNEGPIMQEHYPKTIYLIRDPRAVILSYYHHYLHYDNQELQNLEDFVEEMLTYGCIRQWESYLTRWDTQVNEWLGRVKSQPVIIVRYEDLLENRRKIFKDVVEFCGIECDEKWISLAIERGEFKKMREDEKQHGAESYPGQDVSKGFFVRKGQVDSWKDEMSEELAREIEKEFCKTMKVVGYL